MARRHPCGGKPGPTGRRLLGYLPASPCTRPYPALRHKDGRGHHHRTAQGPVQVRASRQPAGPRLQRHVASGSAWSGVLLPLAVEPTRPVRSACLPTTTIERVQPDPHHMPAGRPPRILAVQLAGIDVDWKEVASVQARVDQQLRDCGVQLTLGHLCPDNLDRALIPAVLFQVGGDVAGEYVQPGWLYEPFQALARDI